MSYAFKLHASILQRTKKRREMEDLRGSSHQQELVEVRSITSLTEGAG